VVFSDFKAAGYYTDRVIPSFFLGTPVENIAARWRRTSGQTGREPALASLRCPLPSFLPDAQRLGWTTGVVVGTTPTAAFSPERSTTAFGAWAMANRRSLGRINLYGKMRCAVKPSLAAHGITNRASPSNACADHAAIGPQARR